MLKSILSIFALLFLTTLQITQVDAYAQAFVNCHTNDFSYRSSEVWFWSGTNAVASGWPDYKYHVQVGSSYIWEGKDTTFSFNGKGTSVVRIFWGSGPYMDHNAGFLVSWNGQPQTPIQAWRGCRGSLLVPQSSGYTCRCIYQYTSGTLITTGTAKLAAAPTETAV
jgi:hypothetical protein